ncbi:KilA-N domain-containing protein [Scytonema sp. NUACC26]|uniref:KilA-N domain-containing protein n=1 Tax=Scytonema sp. NUACC26 TaxID=3140176 RepID=UPI0034DC3F52
MAKHNVKELFYEGSSIRRRTSDGFINLTDMWVAAGQPVNKTPRDWKRLDKTQEFLEHLVSRTGVTPVLVQAKRGKRTAIKHIISEIPGVLETFKGRLAGTYAIPELAIDFAQILSVEFHEWALTALKERIEEEADPELGIKRSHQRAIKSWAKQGKSSEYIQARFSSIPREDYYEEALSQHGVSSPKEFAMCKSQLYLPIIGNTKKFREKRGLKPGQNCKDGMNIEELTTSDFAKVLSAKRINIRNPNDAKACASISYKTASQVTQLLNEVDPPC